VGFSVFQGQFRILARASILPSRIPIYAATLCYEFSLFAYVWLLGLRPRKVRIREVIGGRWNRFADFLADLAAAFLFWMVVIAALGVVRYFIRYNGIEAARQLLPQSVPEIVMFLVLSMTAGFCEEFIFRGLVYRGLRRSARPLMSVLLSAGLFAIVHPPISAAPVFVLGILPAVSFERTRCLLAPMLAHMIYNAAMQALQ